ncbi:hypothetical protein [Candidatus Binatus sp.]|jgi:hypothetical protein|uniref:hypothetical protein n=1 Tax=Candidatus Binatus sp. TaxID=2811406 RepID=UPI003CAA03DE
MSAAEGASDRGDRSPASFIRCAAVWLGLAVVTALAIYKLRNFDYPLTPLTWIHAWRAISPVLPDTAWAAVRVWTFWAVSSCAIAGLLRRYDSSIEAGDAILAGAAGLWVLAYVLGNLVGPLGLMRSWFVWLLLAAAVAPQLRDLRAFKFNPPSNGQKLALIAWALLSVSLLPLQLGSPVPPFMDVLNHPAAVQRILTFHRYLPFDNDPYGAYGARVQAPALELFYAVLGLGAGSKMGALAETAAMVPMAGLMIFSAYRLGRTFFGDSAGGMASLFMFFTCLFRREQGMRATAVVFVLVGIGLAFFLDSRRNRTLFACGAMALGTSVAVHAIGGALAMFVAASAAVFWLASGDFSRSLAAIICLAGALMLAVPELLIGTEQSVSYPILPAIQLAGIAVILAGATRLRAQAPAVSLVIPVLNAVAVIGLFALFICRHSFPGPIFDQVMHNLPMLWLFAALGLIAAEVLGFVEKGSMPDTGIIAVALMVGFAVEIAGNYLAPIATAPAERDMLGNFFSKLIDYWIPFILIFPAGLLFGLLYDRISRPLAFFAVLTILMYPWTRAENPQDYDSDEHAISEQWAFNLNRAEAGYWAGTHDHRWTLGDDGFALVKLLLTEVSAGRITPATHILHLTDTTSAWGLEQVAIFTGIDDDPIDFGYDPNNLFQAGSRIHGPDDLPAALSRHPSYILEQCPAPGWMGDPPSGYYKIFDRGDLRLYRRADVVKNAIN